MSRKPNRMQLIEAIRTGQNRMRERMDSGKAVSESPKPLRQPVEQPIRPRPEKRKKRTLNIRFPGKQFFRVSGFIIGGILVLIAVFWMAKRIELNRSEPSPGGQSDVKQPQEIDRTENPGNIGTSRPPAAENDGETKNGIDTPQLVVVDKTRDHVIVIATYTQREQLLPVQEYFQSNGIKTEIMRSGSYYLLVTNARYDYSNQPNSEMSRALAEVKEIGGQYQPPSGYLSFGSMPFQDAYPKKIK